jgi:hypothetical protein
MAVTNLTIRKADTFRMTITAISPRTLNIILSKLNMAKPQHNEFQKSKYLDSCMGDFMLRC